MEVQQVERRRVSSDDAEKAQQQRTEESLANPTPGLQKPKQTITLSKISEERSESESSDYESESDIDSEEGEGETKPQPTSLRASIKEPIRQNNAKTNTATFPSPSPPPLTTTVSVAQRQRQTPPPVALPLRGPPEATTTSITPQFATNVCEVVMYGTAGHSRMQYQPSELTPAIALGWKLRTNYLQHVQSHSVAQNMESETVSSIGINSWRTDSAWLDAPESDEEEGEGEGEEGLTEGATKSGPLPPTQRQIRIHRVAPQLNNRAKLPREVFGWIRRGASWILPSGKDGAEHNLLKHDAQLDPELMYSTQLNKSLLLPIEKRRRVTKQVFHTKRIMSYLWALMIQTTIPETWAGYLRETIFGWKTLKGDKVIEERFELLRVFSPLRGHGDAALSASPKDNNNSSARPPLYQSKTLTIQGRRSLLRFQIYKRLWDVSTPQLRLALPLYSPYIYPESCTDNCQLEQLIRSEISLELLLRWTPSNLISFNDLKILFELDSVEVMELAKKMACEAERKDEDDDIDGPKPTVASVAKRKFDYSLGGTKGISNDAGKIKRFSAKESSSALCVLKVIGYKPELHFEYPDRFPVACLIDAPWNITWHDIVKLGRIRKYHNFIGWNGFFGPHELHALGFKFKDEVYGLPTRAIDKPMTQKAFVFLCNKSKVGQRQTQKQSRQEEEPEPTKEEQVGFFGRLFSRSTMTTPSTVTKQSKGSVSNKKEEVATKRNDKKRKTTERRALARPNPPAHSEPLAIDTDTPNPNAWTYESLWTWLDFSEEVISHLRLTQRIMISVLAYDPKRGGRGAQVSNSTHKLKYYPKTLFDVLEPGESR